MEDIAAADVPVSVSPDLETSRPPRGIPRSTHPADESTRGATFDILN